MPRGSRGNILAIGLVALLAASAGYLIFHQARWSETIYLEQANQAAQEARDSAAEHVQRACVSTAPSFAECQADEHEAARERERNERDLQAQLVTSAWTRAMGLAALIGMVVGIVGVGLVWTTFAETRRANFFTKLQLVPTFRIEQFSVRFTKTNDKLPHTRLELIFSGPTQPDLIRVTVHVRLIKEGTVTDDWRDSHWNNKGIWEEIIPLSRVIVAVGEDHELTTGLVHPMTAKATVTVAFVDVFGDEHRDTQEFTGESDGSVVIPMHRTMRDEIG